MQRIAGVAFFLCIWQFVSGRLVNAYYASTPLEIGRYIADWAINGDLWLHLSATITTTLSGFLGGSVLGILFALVLASNSFLDKVFYPLIFTLFALPKVIFAPLFILWVGVGQPPAILLSLVTAFFLVFFNMYSGIKLVPRAYLDTAAIFGANWWETAFKFRLPAAAPFLAAALHQGLIYAFHGSIVGEMTASNTGIGYAIVYAATAMDAAGVLAGLAVVGALSYTLIAFLRRVTARRDLTDINGALA